MLKRELWLLPLILLAAACQNGAPEEGVASEEQSAEGGLVRDEAAPVDGATADVIGVLPNNFPFLDTTGSVATYSSDGGVDLGNEFFDDLGTNGRTCGTCHLPEHAWTFTAKWAQLRFDLTGGLDPLFRTNDGSNSPNADVSTVAKRRQAYSMLLNHGVIRVGLPIPANAEFELAAVDDPYGFASAAELSLFRRPLVSTNLDFSPNIVMWDGRETQTDFAAGLAAQADHATLGHAQAADPLTAAEQASIVNFETALFTAQASDTTVGSLSAAGATGGPQALSTLARTNAAFNLFDAWATVAGTNPVAEGRRAIARGQALFNSPNAGAGGGACRGCHSVSNVGTSFAPIFFNINTSAGSRRTPDMPLYTLRRISTNETIQTTDPGRALVTGLWADINRFKAPSLRGLSARAPYFHNGLANTLEEVVLFYESSLGFTFTSGERADLVAFLKAL
jgi:cytochrome c peroxidase